MIDPYETGRFMTVEAHPTGGGSAPSEDPEQIGRYWVVRVLGEGGFGRVYLANDGQLNRQVAIKVPRMKHIACQEDVAKYLAEARTVAGLDHPNIVPIFDIGTTADGLCYVVSKFVEGCDLSEKLRRSLPSHVETAVLIATVGDALQYAHQKGLVHRDIKPANILIDVADTPYVVDFGLALREEEFGQGATLVGTPSYMSPEQARGEGHRVDGRSDIFSLGVVLYEMLVGRSPFKASSQQELLEQISTVEVWPPRQLVAQIPTELERICLKALSKRASDRYTTAKDFANDLRHFLTLHTDASRKDDPRPIAPVVIPPEMSGGSGRLVAPVTASGDYKSPKIVPKGLRAFDAHDADFFLELLPGPADREGLPESIRFWKTRIEQEDTTNIFTVGLIYGPSGCGKSSHVKAGLLPKLSDRVIAIYVEATAAETEPRLLTGLLKRFPALPDNLSLKETVATLRRGLALPAGKKLLIIIDQFEQWLHAKKDEQNTELVQALRQCDGERVQCIVLVRDDFWLAVSRFMRELEIRLVEGQNSALADIFDTDHARKVLTAFGRAFGKLPDVDGKMSKEQSEFLAKAVEGLAQEGRVISVRLALFAEMMKGKEWTSGSLKYAGGTEGVGITFLEEAFGAGTASPEHRYHQRGARAVLKALLPEAGTDIKGHMRSRDELLQVSGYTNRPKDFEDLLRILDSEIRLITPTDPEGVQFDQVIDETMPTGARYYQLTHDYLVHSLREWLTLKQKETRRGRAELLLADRATVWNMRTENRQLPSLRQSLSIRLFTNCNNWTASQRKMMKHCQYYHTKRAIVLAIGMVIAIFMGLTIRGRVNERQKSTHAEGLVRQVLNAETAQVPAIVENMEDYRKWVDPLLHEKSDKSTGSARQKLHTSLALLPVDPGQVDYLYDRLLEANPQELLVIRDALAPYKEQLLDRLRSVLETSEKGKEQQRLRAAAAVSLYDPDGTMWKSSRAVVASNLVLENPIFLEAWCEVFRPVGPTLVAPLCEISRDQLAERDERIQASNLLAFFASDNPEVLADLVMDADENQFAVLYPALDRLGEQGVSMLTREIYQTLPSTLESSDERRERLAKRQANAAVALLRMDRPDWSLLRRNPPDDPRLRSYIIHHLSSRGVDPTAIVRQLKAETDNSARRALLLSLGNFGKKELPPDTRNALLPGVQDIFRMDADPGVHAAAEWLLMRWEHNDWLEQTLKTWGQDQAWRDKHLAEIGTLIDRDKEKSPPRWYVNSQGQTIVVIPSFEEFRMGSPKSERDHLSFETQHLRRIDRSFAISSKPVTLAQFRDLTKDKYLRAPKYLRYSDLPALDISWSMAARYCNFLSAADGIDEAQQCYVMNAKGEVTKLKENYLSLSGYRLPTEAEMEYATRAGATTSRFYGETDELLGSYAWYLKNSEGLVQRVGMKMPNDFGLFDVHGNCLTWCLEPYRPYSDSNGAIALLDREANKLDFSSMDDRVLRGGSFLNLPSGIRSACRFKFALKSEPTIGFRVARSFIP